MKAVIEVGVNQGQDTQRLQRMFNTFVYGFEPVPYLQEKLKKKFSGNPYIVLLQYAIDVNEGEATFHLSKHDKSPSFVNHQYGCSSLHSFNEELEELWPEREDFKVEESVTVKTKRLDTFVREMGITSIDYLHCDAQGNDMNVLESLGEYHSILKEGVIEVAYNIELYSGTNNTFANAQRWMNEHGFEITRIHTGRKDAEANVHFRRKS